MATRQMTIAPPRKGLRTDIQGLRALAVALVVWFHLWPDTLPGGFVGVDIFFVVSGFLITTHLLLSKPSRPKDLATFWGRRIRRLLPASLVVVITALVFAKALAPPQEARFGGIEGIVKILYVQNWQLADKDTDPLAVPPVVQHFWSLSLEEQFYFVWPVLLCGAVLLARRKNWRMLPVAMWTMGSVVVASLAFSIFYTPTNPTNAYFATPTRMWELAIGGLLAAVVLDRSERGVPPMSRWSRDLLTWAGFAAIAATMVTFDKHRAFPGGIALLPVLGAVAVIAAHRDRGINPNFLLRWRPIQYIGDLSYSIYLWHVPLIQLMPYITGHPLRTRDDIIIVVLSVALASLTKHQVEDRFRYHAPRPTETRPGPAPARPLALAR